MNVRERYHNAQVALFQQMADFIIQVLTTVPKTKDDYLFWSWFNMGVRLDIYCKEKGIYLN